MKKNIKVNKSDDETRIDRWLKRRFSPLNQSFVEKNLRRGKIKVNNKKIKSNYVVISGDIVTIYENLFNNVFLQFKKTANKKISIKFKKEFRKSIIFENSDFIILNKWHNISCHAGSKIKISIDDIIKNYSTDYNLVHRLDKETSGLLIIAKNLKATRIFVNLFKEQKIKKIYSALCEGIPKNLNSIVNLKIKSIKNNVQTITSYKVIQKKYHISLILYKPITGKTHQLRIVSKYLNCPIIGDKKYTINHNYKLEKLKLNACYLKFIFKEKEYNFNTKLPSDFINLMKKNNFNINLNQYIKTISQDF